MKMCAYAVRTVSRHVCVRLACALRVITSRKAKGRAHVSSPYMNTV